MRRALWHFCDFDSATHKRQDLLTYSSCPSFSVCVVRGPGTVGDVCTSEADCSVLDGGRCDADGRCRCPAGQLSVNLVCTPSIYKLTSHTKHVTYINTYNSHTDTRLKVICNGFPATVCKTVRPMLSERCLSCPVCHVCL